MSLRFEENFQLKLTKTEELLMHDTTIKDQIALFRGIKPDELSMLCRLLSPKSFAANTTLMMREQRGEAVYIILSGTVKIHVEQSDGTVVIFSILGAGDIVGEMSLLDDNGRSANVVTLEETEILWMDRSAFSECLQTIPALAVNLARVLSTRLRMANERIQLLAARDTESRVARQILSLAECYGKTCPDGSIYIPIRLTQSDIASLLGVTRECINKIIVAYKSRGYISVDENYHITIHALKPLLNRCQ